MTFAGPVHKEALRLEEEGNKILKLNIGNPAPFGFEAPDEILVDVLRNLPSAQGYCDSKGLYSARKAIVQYYQSKGIHGATVNDVYIGNGVSELITMAMQALLNDGNEQPCRQKVLPQQSKEDNQASAQVPHRHH